MFKKLPQTYHVLKLDFDFILQTCSSPSVAQPLNGTTTQEAVQTKPRIVTFKFFSF